MLSLVTLGFSTILIVPFEFSAGFQVANQVIKMKKTTLHDPGASCVGLS